MAESIALEKRIGVNFPLLADLDLKVASAYGVAEDGEERAVPAIFLIDRNRRILWRYVGERAWDRPLWQTVLDEARKASSGPSAAAQ